LYEVLVRRGVKFEFFHRLRNVGLGPASEGPHVASLTFDQQAEVKHGKPYQPLIDVDGLPCWPSAPDWSQLVNGDRLKREKRRFESHWDSRAVKSTTLEVGKHFDFVVLAVGVGAIPLVCPELVASNSRWRSMVEKVKSVPTQALQLWLDRDVHELGWRGPSVNISGYVEPFDTWADMPQLIREESFPKPVRAIAYFCSVLRDSAVDYHDPAYPSRRRAEVRGNAVAFLNQHISGLWPNATTPDGRFRWEALVSAAGTDGADESRIETQFFVANVEPSDRYTLSLPGSLASRISPLDTGYDNLTIAGDWTDCGFNEGCVEAAVMSGRLAAHALSLQPPLEQIVGYDHP
jgi:uncharacterized protein with NAD-binding domain and iron-sulfur cluster